MSEVYVHNQLIPLQTVIYHMLKLQTTGITDASKICYVATDYDIIFSNWYCSSQSLSLTENSMSGMNTDLNSRDWRKNRSS